MYDKVKIWIDRVDVGDGFSTLPTYLDDAKQQTDLKTGELRTFGNLDGLKVNIFIGGLQIIGSLPKYLYNSNIYPVDTKTTKQAFEKIGDALHLSLDEAKVTGFEFGANFLMQHPVKDYLDRLGEMPRLQYYRFSPETLYYRHRGEQQPTTYCFYDKIADAKKKKMEVPKGMDANNLLRCEVRFDGRLPYQLGVPEVKPSTLCEKWFYRAVLERLTNAYSSISKLNKLKSNVVGEIKSVSDAFDALFALLVEQTNSQGMINRFMSDLRAENVFRDRINYTRLKQRIEKATGKAHLTTADELIRELDDSFKNLGAYV